MDIAEKIKVALAILDKEITRIDKKQEETQLDKLEWDKTVDYLKTLIAIEKERKSEKEQEFKTDKALDDAILEEAEKIKKKRENAE